MRTAIGAALGRVFRGIRGSEMRQMPEGGHPLARFARQPEDHIHIVTALGQDHGRCLIRHMPVAAHEGVRLMPVGHALDGLHGHDLADAPSLEQLADRLVEHGVAQHMADNNMQPLTLRQLRDVAAFADRAGCGLLQQLMIAQRQSILGRAIVHGFRRADEQHVRQPRLLQQGFDAVKAHFRRDVIALRRHLHTVGADIGDSDQFSTVGILLQAAGVSFQAAGAQTGDGDGDLLQHELLLQHSPILRNILQRLHVTASNQISVESCLQVVGFCYTVSCLAGEVLSSATYMHICKDVPTDCIQL